MQDDSEIRDDYCRERFGHSNWGYLSTYTKKELANKDEYVLQGGIVYWLKDDIPDGWSYCEGCEDSHPDDEDCNCEQ